MQEFFLLIKNSLSFERLFNFNNLIVQSISVCGKFQSCLYRLNSKVKFTETFEKTDLASKVDFSNLWHNSPQKGGNPSAPSGTDTLLRLNPNHAPHLRPTNRTSGVGHFHGLTGGVYKTRERIHRSMLICDYQRFRLHAGEFQPTIRTGTSFDAICFTSRLRCALYQPLYYVSSPGRKGNTDLTSSPPSSPLPGQSEQKNTTIHKGCAR